MRQETVISSATLPSDDDPVAVPRVNFRGLVLRHGSWASIGRVLNLGLAFVSTFVLARLLTPEDFGRFNVARTTVSFLGTLAAFGLGSTALRTLGYYVSDATSVRQRHFLTQITRIAVWPITGAAIAGFVATLLFGKSLTGGDTNLTVAIVVVLATIACGFLNIATDYVRGVGAPGLANILGNIIGSPVAQAGTLIGAAVFAAVGSSSWLIALAAFAAGSAIAAATGWGFLHRRLAFNAASKPVEAPDAGLPGLREILDTTWPLALTTALAFISSRCDLFLTAEFPDPASMPDYIAARRAIILLVIPMSILNTTVRGIVSPLYAANMKRELQIALRGGSGLVAIPCLVAALVTLVVPQFVLRLILGTGYDGAAQLLQILVAGQLLFVLTGSCALLLSLTGNQRPMMVLNIAGVAALMVPGPWIAARFGATGLAIQFSAVQGALNLAMWVVAWKLTGINTMFSFRELKHWRKAMKRPREFAEATSTEKA